MLSIITLLSSCEVEDTPIKEPELIMPSFKSFAFLKDNNRSLEADVYCPINGCDTITLFVPYAKTDSLVATFVGDYDSVVVDSVIQVSGKSALDFNLPVTYTLKKENTEDVSYTFLVQGYNGLPRVEIQSDQPIESRTEYVSGKVKINNAPAFGIIEQSCKLKGRGNATWRDYPKKPYKIKLETKESVLGFPANKDWVLLAEYCDKSLLRTAYMCEASKAVGMEYTVNYQHVELILNGEYQGTYIITDQVEKGKNRINIKDDGFIIEDDTYWDYEPLYFASELMGYNYTFKYPNADKGDIISGDEKFNYIKAFIGDLERALKAIPEDCETYKNLIDIRSFAKWYISAEVIGNWEPNLFYVLPSKGEKLKMYPMWDAEWSLGLASKGNPDHPYGWYFPPFEPKVDVDIWKNRKYFEYLFKDPEFVSKVKDEWTLFKNNYSGLKDTIQKRQNSIVYSQHENFKVWDILNKYVSVGLVALGSWEAETDYVSAFLDARVKWLDSQLSEVY